MPPTSTLARVCCLCPEFLVENPHGCKSYHRQVVTSPGIQCRIKADGERERDQRAPFCRRWDWIIYIYILTISSRTKSPMGFNRTCALCGCRCRWYAGNPQEFPKFWFQRGAGKSTLWLLLHAVTWYLFLRREVASSDSKLNLPCNK